MCDHWLNVKGNKDLWFTFGFVSSLRKEPHGSAAFTAETGCSACWTYSCFPLVNGDKINCYWQSSLNPHWRKHLQAVWHCHSFAALLMPSVHFCCQKGSTFIQNVWIQTWNSHVGAMEQCFSWVCPLAIQRYLEFSLENDKAVWIKSLLWIIMWELLI